ncbi:MAG: HAD-IA family hydrolase [Clostridiales bacterium]|nr:HAD-IA family hydrolase [Clostridiales bacterium]
MKLKKEKAKLYTAAFFDRDNTLIHRDPAVQKTRAEMIERWSGKPLDVPADLFDRLLGDRRLLTVENEIAFWRAYFAELLRSQGVREQLSARADALFDAYWLKGIVVYPETVPVLDWFSARGYRMGVISDTFPSLRLTLEAVGLDRYFQSFVCSDQVGVMKPEPLIYQTALDELGVTAQESLYVDDYDAEADGARALGFTAFHVCRGAEPKEPWDISSLSEMTEFLS